MPAGALHHVGAVGEDRPAAAGGEEFGAAEAQHADIAPGAGLAPRDRGPRALARVLDDGDALGPGKVHQFRHVHNAAV